MPTRYTKQGELQQLQYEIENEISRDAEPISKGVFGDNARHPDMASVSNAELDRIYRDAYTRNDRTFLMQEAQRDPQQFLDVTDRIGVPDPPTDAQGKPMGDGTEHGALEKSFTPQAVPPQASVPPPAPVAAPAAVPPPVTPMAPAALPPGPVGPPPMAQPPLPGMG